ncbi:PilZ domain-containing protein [Chromatiaceae bacterium AAb-1]|nr:PilZ domain-containing protein [Chromatiaceae bacterium AAb-1]
MNQQQLTDLADEYNDYFSVNHTLSINVRLLGDADTLPPPEHFADAIPEPFLLSSELEQLNHSALRPLNRLGELAEELSLYLQQQARKIDLLMHYLLKQHDMPEHRYQTLSFGGSGCSYLAKTPLQPTQVVEIKLFLDNNEGAVFCYGQVVSCEKEAELWQIKVVFRRIRDEDRELIVRASLHQQSRQLKLRAEQRQQP